MKVLLCDDPAGEVSYGRLSDLEPEWLQPGTNLICGVEGIYPLGNLDAVRNRLAGNVQP